MGGADGSRELTKPQNHPPHGVCKEETSKKKASDAKNEVLPHAFNLNRAVWSHPQKLARAGEADTSHGGHRKTKLPEEQI